MSEKVTGGEYRRNAAASDELSPEHAFGPYLLASGGPSAGMAELALRAQSSPAAATGQMREPCSGGQGSLDSSTSPGLSWEDPVATQCPCGCGRRLAWKSRAAAGGYVQAKHLASMLRECHDEMADHPDAEESQVGAVLGAAKIVDVLCEQYVAACHGEASAGPSAMADLRRKVQAMAVAGTRAEIYLRSLAGDRESPSRPNAPPESPSPGS